MNTEFIIDILYEKNEKNRKKREILRKILTSEQPINSIILQKWAIEQFGLHGKNLFYNILNRLEKLNLIERRTKGRSSIIILTIDRFIERIRGE